MIHIFWRVTFFLGVTFATHAHAIVTENLTYRFYDVQFAKGKSISAAILAASPIRDGGRTFHGYTKWQLSWRFTWRENSATCTIDKVNTTVTALITLPNFISPPAQAKDALKEYLIALRQHELGHFELAKDAAERIDAEIRAQPAMPSCKLLETAANERGNRLLEEVRRKEKQYDADTQHGKTQGAWLTQ